LSGQNAAKFAAGCDYMFYHRSYQQTSTSPLLFEIRTRKYQSYAAGGRDEGRLPDPLGYVTTDAESQDLFVADCTYRTLGEALGILQSEPEPVKTTPVAAATDEAKEPGANGKSKVDRPAQPSTAQTGRPASR